MTRAMQQMHALWCFFIYESLDQTWGLHVDYGVLVAACFVVFLTLSKKKKKRWTCQSKTNSIFVSVKTLFGFYTVFVNSLSFYVKEKR